MILVIEDEPKLAALLTDYLQAAGYETQWIADGHQAVDAVHAHQPDLIVLDLMLPGRDGVDICRDVRRFSNVPIIMVTARVDEIDRLLGLAVGADDYVCKPFSPREVVARIKAILRRTAQNAATAALPEGLVIDTHRHYASLDEQKLTLTPVEMRLLHALVQANGQILSRDQLMVKLYDDHRVVTDRTVDSHVKNLRRKLQAARPDQDSIRSIYGVGYCLEL